MLHEKGVKIKVLASEETSPETVRALSRIADVRLKNNMFGGGVIGDSNQVIILLNEGRSEKAKLRANWNLGRSYRTCRLCKGLFSLFMGRCK